MRKITSFLVVLILLLGFLGARLVGTPHAKKVDSGADKSGADQSGSLYEYLDLFTKALHYIQENYIEEVSPKKLVQGAIRGMVATLDPHSAFLTEDLYEELKVDTEGRFGGLGLEVTQKNDLLTVVSPMEGTPADRADIRAGDTILKIDGVPTVDMDLTDAVKRMRGKVGTKIRLLLQRQKVKEPLPVTLTREIIRVRSVRFEKIDEEYGYLRISTFQEGTSKDLVKALRTLQQGSLKGLILDLRNNPGGLLDEAVQVSEQFLKEGVIVTTKSRTEEMDKKEARDDGTEPVLPIVTLINGGTASAGEIVAGALQDHRRAILLGSTSFGKGSVQTVIDLGKKTALKLTIARYYTPSGRSIQAEGIHPDVVVETPEAAAAIRPEKEFIKEKDLKGHLEGEGKKEESKEETEDFQKQAALNYLKSWSVFSRSPVEKP